MYCKSCGSEIKEEDIICTICGSQIIMHKRYPKTAMIVSFIPGLGQIYNGELLKGILFIMIDIILMVTIIILTAFSTIFPTLWTYTLIVILIGIIFWVYNIYDAYRGAKKDKKES